MRSNTKSGGSTIYTYALGGLQALNPADSTTYYCGLVVYSQITTISSQRQFYLPTGSLKSLNISAFATVLGTAENVTVNLRNITDATSTLIGTFTMNLICNSKLITGLNIPTDSTKLYALELVMPVFVTNPITTAYTFDAQVQI